MHLQINTIMIKLLKTELHRFSIIISLEKKPDKKGNLIKEKAEIVKTKLPKEEIRLTIYMFCMDWLLLLLWINNLETKNNKLLKKAWVNNKKNLWLPEMKKIVKIIKPSWELVL